MNITNYNMMSQFRLMSQLLSAMTGKTANLTLPDSLDKTSWAYQNRYADNILKVNSQGLTGMIFKAGDPTDHRQIIGISEEAKQKIFNMVKYEFLQENGIANGDTTHRTEVGTSILRGIPEGDRAKASWTLDRLEAEYWCGFADAAKQTNPAWEPGRAFDRKVLEGLTRKDLSGGPIDTQSSMGIDLRV